MNKQALILIGIVIVVIGGVLGLALWLQSVSPSPVMPDTNIIGEKVYSRSYSHMTGTASAKVTLVEFADFQCPYCAQSFAPVKADVDKYKTNPNFNFVFRNYPLPQHSNAQVSAEVAEAAGAQGKYWEMIELLYVHQNDWSGNITPNNEFNSYANQLGLNLDQFKSDVAASKYINNIAQDQADGNAWGISGTPAFFLNGQAVANYTELDSLIAALLVAK